MFKFYIYFQFPSTPAAWKNEVMDHVHKTCDQIGIKWDSTFLCALMGIMKEASEFSNKWWNWWQNWIPCSVGSRWSLIKDSTAKFFNFAAYERTENTLPWYHYFSNHCCFSDVQLLSLSPPGAKYHMFIEAHVWIKPLWNTSVMNAYVWMTAITVTDRWSRQCCIFHVWKGL